MSGLTDRHSNGSGLMIALDGAPGQTRSRIIAIPWPTPMHMVQRA